MKQVFKSEVDRAIEAQHEVIRRVIEIMYELRSQLKSRKQVSVRTLENLIRAEFDFMEVRCKGCGQWLPKKEYSKEASRRFGVYPYCTHCRAIDYAKYFEKHKTRIRKRNAAWSREKRRKQRDH